MALLVEFKECIRSAPYAALRAVNLEMLSLCRAIRCLIDQRQHGETRGRAGVENLAKYLRAGFPGVGGFSAANFWRIKEFHEAYAKEKKTRTIDARKEHIRNQGRLICFLETHHHRRVALGFHCENSSQNIDDSFVLAQSCYLRAFQRLWQAGK